MKRDSQAIRDSANGAAKWRVPNVQIGNGTRYNLSELSMTVVPGPKTSMLPKPNISLDEFLTDPTLDDIIEPPRQVFLQSTGEYEVLKPLAYWEAPATEQFHTPAATPAAAKGLGFTWFHGSMIAGGALVLLGIALAAALIVRSSFSQPQQAVIPEEVIEVIPESETAVAAPSPGTPSQAIMDPTEPAQAEDPAAIQESVTAYSETDAPEPSARPSRRAAAVSAARNVARSEVKPRSGTTQTKSGTFVPSKTVIYVENGQIKKRVEPQSKPSRKN